MAIIYRITWIRLEGQAPVVAGYSFHYSLQAGTLFQQIIAEKNKTLELEERLFIKNDPDMRIADQNFYDQVKGYEQRALHYGELRKNDPTKPVFNDQKIPTLETMIRR